jgi:hypothetical protein
MTPVELGSQTTRDVPARRALAEVLIHQVSSNEQDERHAAALSSIEADLSPSSTSLLPEPKLRRVIVQSAS